MNQRALHVEPTRAAAGGPTAGADGQRWAVCVHEAGHAVAAFWLGAPVVEVKIERDEHFRWVGGCRFMPAVNPVARAVIGLAGGLAAAQFGGVSLDEAGRWAGSDALDCDMNMLTLPAHLRGVAGQLAHDLAMRVVCEQRAAIERLADWLATVGYVGGTTARVLIESALTSAAA